MTDVLSNSVAGSLAVASDNPRKDAAHMVTRHLRHFLSLSAGTTREACLDVLQAPIKVTGVYLVPSAATTASASNFATITLQKGDTAAGALTSLASWSTDSGAEGALSARTRANMTIVGAAADLLVDDGVALYAKVTQSGTGAAVTAAVIVEYELQGAS